MIVVLAEKPSVARDIANVLGASQRRQGYLEGQTHIVTWALGHLVDIPPPDQINEAWGGLWTPKVLPMLPARFPLIVNESTKSQFAVIKRLFCRGDITEIVCATDAGREGELIFRWIYEATGATARCKRLWISSLTAPSIRAGFHSLKPLEAYDNLAAAARARAEADWTVGMNFSRAYTLASGQKFSVGRVQTPTLALVVKRDAEIAKHVPEHFRKVFVALQTPTEESLRAVYTRRVEDPKTGEVQDSEFLPPAAPGLGEEHDADLVAARARLATARVLNVERTQAAASPPRLFDLAELQRTAIRLWGWTAKEVLEVGQELYEKHKVLSYPRTDSRHLSADVALTLPSIVEAVRGPYSTLIEPDTGRRPLTKRFVDDSKVTDHHAIIPTGTSADSLQPGTRPWQLYDLVCRRLLQAWQPDCVEAVAVATVELVSGPTRDRYVARGRSTVKSGWKALELRSTQTSEQTEPVIPARLNAGSALVVLDVEVKLDKTKPRPPFNEATLLKAMELAGESLSDELAEAMKARGLGTPATRAAVIERLLAGGYVVRSGKSLRSTPLGAALVAQVHKHVCSAAMTGEWEERLRRLEQGVGTYEEFIADVSKFVSLTVRDALRNGVKPRASAPQVSSKGKRKASSVRSGVKATRPMQRQS